MRPLEQALASISFARPEPAVVTNVEAAPNDDPARIAGLLVRQVTAPVRWTDSIRLLRSR